MSDSIIPVVPLLHSAKSEPAVHQIPSINSCALIQIHMHQHPCKIRFDGSGFLRLVSCSTLHQENLNVTFPARLRLASPLDPIEVLGQSGSPARVRGLVPPANRPAWWGRLRTPYGP
jgi:hypothetical protein